jgi:formyltetrahydrofolate synthetase
MRNFGQSVVVSMNQFKYDTDEEINYLTEWCEKEGVAFAINNGFAKGGEGAAARGTEGGGGYRKQSIEGHQLYLRAGR